jgi:phage shock protein A
MGTFSRLRYVIAANVNALLEKAEDPEKLLRALIREMEDAGEDARLAVADLLAEQEHLDRVIQRIEAEVREWQDRAEKAVATDREDLARAALKAKAELEEGLSAARDDRVQLSERVGQLEADMNTLKAKLSDAKKKLKAQTTRRPAAKSGGNAPEPAVSPGERKIRQAMNRFDRLQSQVERLEARVRSYEVGGVEPPAWDSTEPADPAIEAELEALKAKAGMQKRPKPAETGAEVSHEPKAEEA